MQYLIVDANVGSHVFVDDHPDFQPVRDALFRDKPKPWGVAHGGRLSTELCENSGVRRVLAALDRAGRALIADAECLKEETMGMSARRLCRSNDIHVLAVARCTGARLLCSRDDALSSDFTNTALISNPRGKVYRNASHAHLLRY